MRYKTITWSIHVNVYTVIHVTLHVFHSLGITHLHFITSMHNGIVCCIKTHKQLGAWSPALLYKCNAQPMDCFVQNLLPISPTNRAPGWSHCHCHRRRFKSDYMQPPPKHQKILILFITFFFRRSDPPDPFNCTNVKRSRGNGRRKKKDMRAQQSRQITARNNTA